jgi:hypothetical protein
MVPITTQSLVEAFLGPRTFAAVLEAAGFPSLGDLDVGGDLFDERGDVHIAEAVVESRDVVRIADGSVELPIYGFGVGLNEVRFLAANTVLEFSTRVELLKDNFINHRRVRFMVI